MSAAARLRPGAARPRWRGAAGLLALALALAPAALEAASRQVEVVGVAPAGADAPDAGARQAALEDALARAVRKVAAELLGRTPEALEAEGDLEALGLRSPAAYALRFQVLEDRGERRAVLLPDPEVATERALQVQVSVDADRLAADLRAAGRLEGAPPGPAAGGETTVELVDVASWHTLEGVRQALLATGAEAVTPSKIAAGRAELRVEGRADARALLGAVRRTLPEGLRVEVLDVGAGHLRLRVADRRPEPETPPAAGAGERALD